MLRNVYNSLGLLVMYTRLGQAMSLHTVFVYGTLKTGEPNHHWFTNDNGYWKFIGKATTVEKYPLIIGTKYNIPFLLYSPGIGMNIHGEVYEVDNNMLDKLDELEEHPKFYQRELEEVKMEDSNLKPWIYFLKNFRPELLQSTFYSNYSTNGDHGLQYIESETNLEEQP